jgi:5-methylthioadenosine/S-adenosylhomocysteine deaminase
MPAVPADLTLSCRWMLPMTSPGEVLEGHTVVVRDGRILDIVPDILAAERYQATVHIDRPLHALLPGLVNACAQIAPPVGRQVRADRIHDGALLAIAEMLKAGTTCFGSVGYFPEESARVASEQGMRALIGVPIAETAGSWAASPAEYLTRALAFRDGYAGHPTIATAFAPLSPTRISDATFARIATLTDELDAGVLIPLHTTRAEVEESVARYGKRPIERLHALGLLTPALTAVHMAHTDSQDIALAHRAGIALTLCLEANFRSDAGGAPVAQWLDSGLRLGVGTGITGGGLDLWSELNLLALCAQSGEGPQPAQRAWDALGAATRGGAAALGLDAEIGTLETGKWADLCCVDLQAPALQWAWFDAASELAAHLVYDGGRDNVSDVWVCGRHLLNGGVFTRLDWPALSARVNGWRKA